MLFPRTQSVTSALRVICDEIQSEINITLSTYLSPADTKDRSFNFRDKSLQKRYQNEIELKDKNNSKISHTTQQLKSELIQIISNKLPKIINLQEQMNEKIEELQTEANERQQKYRNLFHNYQNNQLQNDQMKMEILLLSQNYENIVKQYEKVKFMYYELKEKQSTNPKRQVTLQVGDDITPKLNKDLMNKLESLQQHKESDIVNQTLAYEKQLFLIEIRESQNEIVKLKIQNKQYLQTLHQLQMQNEELNKLLKGQKSRSDKLDRQILDILNKNQDVKLQNLQYRQNYLKIKEGKQKLESQMQSSKEQNHNLRITITSLKKQLTTNQQKIENMCSQLAGKQDQLHMLDEKIKQYENKITAQNKQNEQLRTQIDRLLIAIQQNTKNLEADKWCVIQKLNSDLLMQKKQKQLKEKQLKSKNSEKVQQITKMNKQIKQKYEQKIILMERANKQLKQKNKNYKFEIERLYESLELQVSKQMKNEQKIKVLQQKNSEIQKCYKQISQNFTIVQQNNDQFQNSIKQLKRDLIQKQKKLKRLESANMKLSKVLVPKIKQEIYNFKMSVQHIKKMIQLQKQQLLFFIQKREENYHHLAQQYQLKNSIHFNKHTDNLVQEIGKWKQNCQIYENKYQKLQKMNEGFQSQIEKQLISQKQNLKSKDELIKSLTNQIQSQKFEQKNTIQTIEKLKQKCKQVEQYYKLIEQLSRQNHNLKIKLENTSFYSFKIPQRQLMNHTSKKSYYQEQKQPKQSKNTFARRPVPLSQDYDLNQITTRAQFQKLRLQAVKKEYNTLINQP